MTTGPEQFSSTGSSVGRALAARAERVFVAKKGALGHIAGTWALGFALLAVSAWLTVQAAHTPATPDNPFRPGISAGFFAQLSTAILGMFALLRGVLLLRTTRRVVLTADGARIDNWISGRFVRWEAVQRIERTTRPVPYSDRMLQVIELVAANDRRLATISDTLQDFETLSGALSGLPAARESGEAAERDQARNLSKERRRLRIIAFGFLLFTLGMAGALAAGINEEWHVRQLARNGVSTEATVLRTWRARVTPYVAFSFRDASGHTFSREAMMYEGPEWEKLKTAKTMTVVYLPSAPEWNRVDGENPDAQFGGSFLFLSSGGLLMFGVLFVTTLLGYNVKTENGVSYLTRHGQTIRQWGRPS